MNKVFLIGRLVRDVDFKEGSTNIARLTVAVDRKFKTNGQTEADFISCVAFGKTADFVSKYFAKGSKIVIEGRWQTGTYTNRDGQKVYTNDCVIDAVEFGESKRAAESEAATPSAPPEVDDFMNLAEGIDDEMPFGK